MKAGIIIDAQEETRLPILLNIFGKAIGMELKASTLVDKTHFVYVDDDFSKHKQAREVTEMLAATVPGYVQLGVEAVLPEGRLEPLAHDEYIDWCEARIAELEREKADLSEGAEQMNFIIGELQATLTAVVEDFQYHLRLREEEKKRSEGI